ncbi:FAD-binding oxidoreductase, partial [uncultured Duncaniella sp.]
MKQVTDFIIISVTRYNDMYSRLTLAPADGSKLPEILPGQFVQVAAETPGVFLRRPISINDVDYDKNTIDLLIRKAGTGTAALLSLKENDTVNILLPLGNGFSTTAEPASRLMLIGGGVGVAPLLYLGRKLKETGHCVEFLLGARSGADILEMEQFEEVGRVH